MPMPRVLLVDDDDLVRQALRLAMELGGLEVREAKSVEVVANPAALNGVDLLVTDVLMPQVDGLELLLHLKSQAPDLPVIVTSGGGRVEGRHYLEDAQALGAKAVFEKPFDERDLIAEINRLIADRDQTPN